MPQAPAPAPDVDHPSPHRERIPLSHLLYGLIAAPLAWATGQILSSALAQEACFPGDQPLVRPAFQGLHLLHLGLLIASLAISLSGALVAFRAWRATQGERDGGAHTLLGAGEGRARFMAYAGILTSLGFTLGAAFSIPALMFVPAC